MFYVTIFVNMYVMTASEVAVSDCMYKYRGPDCLLDDDGFNATHPFQRYDNSTQCVRG